MKRLLCLLLAAALVPGLLHPVSAADKEDIKEEIMYDILVDRFNNGSTSLGESDELDDPYAYHGGDLQGIIAKLDHLQEYGFTTIVLSPIMANAPDGYHGYWIEDFYHVDDHFGTMDDLRQLVSEAHDRDIKVVLELVTKYVSDTHPMTEDPEKQDWYTEMDDDTSFKWQKHTVQLNQTNPEVQTFLTDIADFWIDQTDIDGYRFHAADKADQDFLSDLTTHIHENHPDFYLLGHQLDEKAKDEELMNNTAIQMADNPALMPVMADVLAEAGKPVNRIHETWKNSRRQEGINYLDTPFAERFSERVLDSERNMLTAWKLALTYLYTVPGTPIIYQGSEIPMLGEDVPENQHLVEWNSLDEDLEEFFHRIAALRSQFPALQHGDYEQIATNEGMSVFKRSYDGESIYIAINNDSESRIIPISNIDTDLQLDGVLEDNLVKANDDGDFDIILPRETAEVYIPQKDTGLNWMIIVPTAAILIIFVGGIVYLTRKEKSG